MEKQKRKYDRYAPTDYAVEPPIAFDAKILGNDNFRPGQFAVLGGDKILSDSTNYYQFEYIIEGNGYIEIEGKRHKVSAGDFFYLGKSLFRTISADPQISMNKYFLTARGAFVDGTLNAYFPKKSYIICRCDVSEHFKNMMVLCEENEKSSKKLYNDLALEFLKLIQHIADTLSDSSSDTSSLQNKVTADKIMHYLDENVHVDFSLKDIADEFFISRPNLVRIFKEKYDITPMEYLRGRRIALAKYYLNETDLPITQIAELVPIGNTKYFSNIFKKFTGMTPREYRNKKRN